MASSFWSNGWNNASDPVDDLINKFQKVQLGQAPIPVHVGGFISVSTHQPLGSQINWIQNNTTPNTAMRTVGSSPPINWSTRPEKKSGRLSLPNEATPRIPIKSATISEPILSVTKGKVNAAKTTRRSSLPLERSSSAVQCAGVTRDKRRCIRTVSAHESFRANPDEEPELFCHQHRKKLMQQPEFFSKSRPGLAEIEFDAWIREELQEETKVALRTEMEKPPSPADEPGEIYVYVIRDKNTPGYVHFKVGRSNNTSRRLDDWSKQCGGQMQIARGRYPPRPDGSLLRGKMESGDMVSYSHRLERLVHIDLADLSYHMPYLNPGWHTHIEGDSESASVATSATPTRRSRRKTVDTGVAVKACADCGKIHREIFTFKKMTGQYENQEWERVVWPVISKWGLFVETYL